ncbi:hypothetical protein JHK85_001764 [Glycine max]|uniref:Uncharacterized protein n=1 Tax=Glycine soja TaxID=3848 RepID=A0A0B2QVA8_GLYSO|nr:hypothetical protein JHK85_001764 [Glycine max]KHN25556.1 hypothetical protein glysoja_035684 [Glycine soja]
MFPSSLVKTSVKLIINMYDSPHSLNDIASGYENWLSRILTLELELAPTFMH